MYADDLCILRAGTDLSETARLIQQDVDAVVKWSHDNGIVLNSQKTKLLLLHSPYLPINNPVPPIFAHSFNCIHHHNSCVCKPIDRERCVTYLGLKVDEHFSWNDHTDYICDKLRVLLGKFYHLSFRVPPSTLKCIYMSLVDSVVSYALDCYGLTFKTNIDKLENIQIRFLKLLVNNKTKNKCKNNYRKLFKICKILPIGLKHKYLLATNNHSNREHGSFLIKTDNVYNTRSMTSGKYDVPRVTNYYGDRTLQKRIPYLLNSLPEVIRTEPKFNKFKKKLRTFFLDNIE